FVKNRSDASNKCIAVWTKSDVTDGADSSGPNVPHRLSERFLEEDFAILRLYFAAGIPDLRDARDRASDQIITIVTERCANDSVARRVGHENRLLSVGLHV